MFCSRISAGSSKRMSMRSPGGFKFRSTYFRYKKQIISEQKRVYKRNTYFSPSSQIWLYVYCCFIGIVTSSNKELSFFKRKRLGGSMTSEIRNI